MTNDALASDDGRIGVESDSLVSYAKAAPAKLVGAACLLYVRVRSASLEFLGYSFGFDRDLKGRGGRYLNMQPSKTSLTRVKERLREWPVLTTAFNRFLT